MAAIRIQDHERLFLLTQMFMYSRCSSKQPDQKAFTSLKSVFLWVWACSIVVEITELTELLRVAACNRTGPQKILNDEKPRT